MSHRLEVVTGLITSTLGAIGIGFAVFGPATFSYGTDWLTAGSTSLWEQGLDSTVVLYLAVMLLAAVAATVGAYLRNRPGTEGMTVLWVGVIALLVGAAVTLPGSTTALVPSALHTDTADSVGIGIYFVPAALMALATVIVSTAMHHTPRRHVSVRPH